MGARETHHRRLVIEETEDRQTVDVFCYDFHNTARVYVNVQNSLNNSFTKIWQLERILLTFASKGFVV